MFFSLCSPEPAAHRRTLNEKKHEPEIFCFCNVGKVNLPHDFSSSPSTHCHCHFHFSVGCPVVVCTKDAPLLILVSVMSPFGYQGKTGHYVTQFFQNLNLSQSHLDLSITDRMLVTLYCWIIMRYRIFKGALSTCEHPLGALITLAVFIWRVLSTRSNSPGRMKYFEIVWCTPLIICWYDDVKWLAVCVGGSVLFYLQYYNSKMPNLVDSVVAEEYMGAY